MKLKQIRPHADSGAAMAAGGVLLIAVAGLLAYLPGWERLGRVQEYFIPMAPSTAVCFLVLSLVLFVRRHRSAGRRSRLFCAVAVLAVTLFGLLEALEYAGLNAGIEERLVPVSGDLNGIPIGRMSPATGFGFLSAGLSLLLLLLRKQKSAWSVYPVLATAVLTFVTGFLFLLAYCYGDPLMYGGNLIPMALTTAAAFVLLGFAEMMLSGNIRTSLLFGLFFFCMAGGIVTVGVFHYESYERSYRAEAGRQLLAIADLKVDQLTRWRRERLGDGRVLFQNPVFSRQVQQFLQSPDPAADRQGLEIWLGKVQTEYDYKRILLLDADGQLRLSVPDGLDPPGEPLVNEVSDILRTGRIGFQDFHRHAPELPVLLSVQVPVYAGDDGTVPLGVCVLQIDPHRYLYPFLRRWPVPSETAETLLVRREGDQVAFISSLRFNTNRVLSVHLPLSRTNLPAVQAVRGREGLFQGVDYRNKPVLSALRAIPGTPWFLVARRDTAEVFAPIRERLRQVILMTAILLFAAAAAGGMLWRHQRVVFYRQKAAMTEKLSVSNRDLEQFAYVASHDLQEPLRMVANYVQLLEKRYGDRLDQDARDFIAFAADGAVRMQQMIDSLLNYSRLNTQQKPFEPVDLNAVFQRVLRDLERRILETGATVTARPLPAVYGDKLQLGLLFQNLISNAIKFRGEAPPDVRITARASSSYWKITVADNGIGIEPAYQERIFKIFQRLHSRSDYPGTGIGLSVCRRIIERHGGTIGVQSVYGKGSSFWFTLPKKGAG